MKATDPKLAVLAEGDPEARSAAAWNPGKFLDGGLLTRLARVAATSLLWKPEPATALAWSIGASAQYAVLASWREADHLDLAAFATWVAKEVFARDDAESQPDAIREALRRSIDRWRESNSTPRVPAALDRAAVLLRA